MLVLYRLARVPVGYLLKGLRGILILLCFTFLFRMLYTPGDAVASVWIFTITKQGIWKAVQMTARIALMITGASLLSYTSTPKELADGLEKAFSGLGKIGVPVHEMAVIVMIAFRFIPIMLEELNVLMDAQAARGARFEEGNVVEKCKGVMTLLFPLFLMTVRRSSDLAMAMEARGYTGSTETSNVVLPKPGGPASRIWSGGTSRLRAASRNSCSWALSRGCPIKPPRTWGRSSSSLTGSLPIGWEETMRSDSSLAPVLEAP